MYEDWYIIIEEPVREIVKALRNNGINTTSSCGHLMYIQCHTISKDTDLDRIYNAMCQMKINKYKVILVDSITDGYRNEYLDILLPDKNGNYCYNININHDFIKNK